MSSSITKKVNETSCSQYCEDKINKYREHNELLVREVFDLKNKIYEIQKINKLLKENLEAQTKDLSMIKFEYNTKCVHYQFAKEKIANLTTELDELKAKFEDAD